MLYRRDHLMTRLLSIASLAVVVLALGCGDSGATDPDGAVSGDGALSADGAATDANLAGFEISVTSPLVHLRPGESAPVTLNLSGMIGSGVTITASGAPAGVTIDAEVVTSTGEVELTASAALGAVANVPMTTTITATAMDDASETASASVDIRVLGAPGSLDETYDTDGTLLIDFSASGLDNKIAFEPNGDFYLNDVGTAGRPVRRYRAVGTVDPSFVNAAENTSAGVTTIPIDATHVAIRRTFIGGGDLSLHTHAGALVPSFGGTGRITPAHDLSDAIFANGAIYTLGVNAGKGRVQRVSMTGAVSALTTSDVFGLFSYTELAVDAQGRVVVGGEDEVTANGRTGTIARLTAAGQVDASFGVDGKLTISSPLANTLFVSVAVALADDGSGHALIHFTTSSSIIGGQSVLVPFSATGVAGSAVSVTEVSPTSFASLVVEQADGKVLVAGSDAGVGFVRRYLADGSPDISFATDGSLTLAQVPDRMNLFTSESRIVLTTFDQTFNAWKLYLTRVWI